jgi:hypothetical protein
MVLGGNLIMTILKGPWSYSRATSCARALWMEKVLKAPPEPRPERFLAIDRRDLGTVLHSGAEAMLKTMVAGEPWPDPRLVTRDCIKSHVHLTPAAVEIEESLTSFAHRFRCEWQMDEVERDSLIRNTMLGSEMRLAIDADDKSCSFDKCPENGWRGIVDYADVNGTTLTVIDFKNRPAKFSDAELRVDEQLSGYLHLVMCQYPGQYDTFIVGIYYFVFGHLQLIELTVEEVMANVKRMRARAMVKESLTKDEIGPEPGFGKCQYCDYLQTCDAGSSYMKGGQLAPTDADQAGQTAAWFMVMSEKLRAAKKSLQMFTGEFGPIELDDKTLVGYALKDDAVSYDKNKTLRILKQLLAEGRLDGKLSDFTSLAVTEVKKAAKAKHVDEALAPARKPKVDLEFDFFRPAKKRGVRTAKEGRKTVVHPDDNKPPRKTRGRVKSGGKP